MHKFLIALGLVATIIIENWLWPGWFVLVYGWSLGFLPFYVQAILLLIIGAGIAFFASRFLGGFVGLPVLAILAVMPLLGFRLGWVDDQLGDVARKLATNPRDVQEIAQVHSYLHIGVVVAATIIVLAFLTLLVRRVLR